MAAPQPDPLTSILLSLTRLTARWNSLEYQRRVTEESGVTLDPAAVRAVYLLGLNGGSARPSALATDLELSRPSTSKLLARLETAGLVERSPADGDGRATTVSLRAAGHEAFERLFAAGIGMVGEATADWEPTDSARLAELLPRFVEGLLANPGRPAAATTQTISSTPVTPS